MNVTLLRKQKAKKTGRESWVAEGYFANVVNVLDYLVDFEIKGTGLKDFQTVSKKIDELHALIATTASTINDKGKERVIA